MAKTTSKSSPQEKSSLQGAILEDTPEILSSIENINNKAFVS